MKPDEHFMKCYEEHSDAVFRFCMLRVSNRDIALDISQDVFMRFWDKLVEGENIRNERALLFTIARNLVIDQYRKHTTDSLDALKETGFDPDTEPDSELRSEFNEAVASIENLDASCRDVLLLRYMEGLPPREIASIIGESVNNVSVRINRCMKKLRTLLAV